MSFSNGFSDEGNLSGNKTIIFPWKPRELQITNDSATEPFKYRFNEVENWRTLNPYQTSTVKNISIRKLYIMASGVDYRIWGQG